MARSKYMYVPIGKDGEPVVINFHRFMTTDYELVKEVVSGNKEVDKILIYELDDILTVDEFLNPRII